MKEYIVCSHIHALGHIPAGAHGNSVNTQGKSLEAFICDVCHEELQEHNNLNRLETFIVTTEFPDQKE